MPGPGVDCLVTVSGQPQAAPQRPDLILLTDLLTTAVD